MWVTQVTMQWITPYSAPREESLSFLQLPHACENPATANVQTEFQEFESWSPKPYPKNPVGKL